MKIATFNINGIKARIEALPAWLDEAAPDVAEPASPALLPECRGNIRIEGVHFDFGRGNEGLAGIDIEIRAFEHVVIAKIAVQTAHADKRLFGCGGFGGFWHELEIPR